MFGVGLGIFLVYWLLFLFKPSQLHFLILQLYDLAMELLLDFLWAFTWMKDIVSSKRSRPSSWRSCSHFVNSLLFEYLQTPILLVRVFLARSWRLSRMLLYLSSHGLIRIPLEKEFERSIFPSMIIINYISIKYYVISI